MLQACGSCGAAYDFDKVQSNPFKVCPTCKAPLDEGAVAHRYVEAGNPSDSKDAARLAGQAQHLADVAGMAKSRTPAVSPV